MQYRFSICSYIRSSIRRVLCSQQVIYVLCGSSLHHARRLCASVKLTSLCGACGFSVLCIFCVAYGLLYELKGAASQLNKLVLKDSPHIYKLSGTNLFPKSRHQYIYQLLKNRAPSRVSNHSLPIATSGCEQRVVADTARGRVF